jgi:cytidylate kinase
MSHHFKALLLNSMSIYRIVSEILIPQEIKFKFEANKISNFFSAKMNQNEVEIVISDHCESDSEIEEVKRNPSNNSTPFHSKASTF